MNRHGRLLPLALAIACLALAVLAAGALAASFGDGGRIVPSFGSRAVAGGTVEGVALAPDGRVAVAVAGGTGLPVQVAVLDPDGSLDRGFSGDGTIQPQLEPGRPFRAGRVRIAFDGEDLLVAGGVRPANQGGETGDGAIAVREYRPDGSLAPGFGQGGVATGRFAEASALFVQPGGEIALFGSGERVGEGLSAGGLQRFSPSGKAQGAVALPDAGSVGGVSMEADGGFLAATGSGEEPFSGTILRLDPSGKVLAEAKLNEGETLATRLIGSDAEGAPIAYRGATLTRLEADLRTPDPSFAGSSVPCAPGAEKTGYERALPGVGGTTLLAGACGIARVHADGSPDPSFGSDGLVATPLRSPAIAVAADGTVVYATWPEGSAGPEVARLAPNGSPDPAFGDGGHATFGLTAPVNSLGRAVVGLPGGRGFVAAGGASCAETNCAGFALARYGRDGHLVRGFGVDGKALVSGAGLGTAHAVALAPGGRIVAAGTTRESGDPPSFALAEVGRNGAPVRGFGEDGVVVHQFSTDPTERSEAEAVAVQPDGRIVVAGLSGGCKGYGICFTVARYLPDGAPDRSFAHDGVLRLGGRRGPAMAIALAPHGKIVVAGGEFGHFVTVRLTSRGRLDRGFGHGGIVDHPQRIRFHQNGKQLIDLGVSAETVTVSRGGAVTVAGGTGGAHSVIERYAPNGKAMRGFGHAGRITIAGFGVAALRPSACGLVAAGSFKRPGREEQMGVLRIAASGRRHTAPRALFGPQRPSVGAALALVGGRVVVVGQVKPFEWGHQFALAGAPLKSLGRCS